MEEPRTAIVTGASGGVGQATARALAAMGMHVALVARRRERLDTIVRSISDRGGKACAIVADLRDAAQAERAMDEAREMLGSVDALVNCLGTNVPNRRLDVVTVSDWDSVVATNLSAIFYCVRAVLPSMRERGTGMIVSISSIAGLQPSVLSGSAYSASKAALGALSTCINLEEGNNGIRSCIISPGDINTEILDKRPHPPPTEERQTMLQPQDVAGLIVTTLRQPSHAWVDYIVVRPRPVAS